ncbi:MAG: hypothetical protein FWB79_01210 [Treponema sp.]|nr:hypothetical protein [Treponema sp.]
MKRVLLTLLGILVVAGFCMAQTGDFRQQGMASQVMQTNGMTAAHPSLPIGSNARVISTATNNEIEVTITGRIMPSLDRVIDLSPAAAQALGIVEHGHVIITTASPPLPQPVPPPVQEPPTVVFVEPEPAPVPVAPVFVVVVEPEPEPKLAEPEPSLVKPEPVLVAVIPEPPSPLPEAAPPQQQQPIVITIHNYIVVPDNPLEEHRDRYYRNATTPVPEPHEEIFHALPPPQEPLFMSLEPPINGVVVIPGLPDPHNNRVYRLQVGAYSGTGSASLTIRRVESAGFVAAQERYGNLFRVFIDDIPSSNVQSAVQRLAALGFTQVWVRE